MKNKIVALSLVLAGAQAPLADLQRLKSAAKAALLESCVVPWAVLGVDFSVNDDTQRGLGTYRQLQLYGFASTTDRKALREALLIHFPKSDTVRHPVRITDYDSTRYGASYGFKTGFLRRVSYLSSTGKYPGWRTRKVSLTAPQHVELMLALDKIGFQKRVLLFGLAPEITSNGVILRKLK